MRIELFNKKTLHEVYDFDIHKHIDFNNNEVCATLRSKEKTLGPYQIECWFIWPPKNSAKAWECMLGHIKKSFISHLNENVGVECFMRKEDIPIDIFDDFKIGVVG